MGKKQRRIMSLFLAIALLLTAFPIMAFAANHTPANGDTIDLGTCSAGDTITIAGGYSATITGNGSNIRIICGAGVALTLNNVTITNTTNGYSPVTFTGEGNALTIIGNNSLKGGGTGSSGSGAPAVATVDASLVINGTGTLNATGGSSGNGGAGIGGGNNGAGGNITVLGGTIIAKSGNAVRGRYKTGEGICAASITISGGLVTANGHGGGAGIGGNLCAPGSSVTILGGTVTATGNNSTPGIGGYGSVYTSPTIAISGGRIIANGSTDGSIYSSGIGSTAVRNDSGSIIISGGEVFASCKYSAPDYNIHDIGNSGYAGVWTLNIGGTATVFLQNSKSVTPVTAAHTLETFSTTDAVYGIALPDGWSAPFSAYLPLATLSYDLNGGSGSTPAAVTQLAGSAVTVGHGSGLTRTNCSFMGWNTMADGSGTTYRPDDDLNFGNDDITLYAQWKIDTVEVSGLIAPAAGAEPISIGSLVEGHTVYTITDLVWQNSDGSAADLSDGKFKADVGYRVVIELTAGADTLFQPMTPTVTAGTAAAGIVNTNTAGNKLIFVVTFPTTIKTVTGLGIISQPDKMTYTEGETLDLTGLEVTLTYNDSLTKDVAAADFAANGITANPASGTILTVAAHNGQAITLSCNGHDATTDCLTMSVAIPGVPSIQSATAGNGKVTLTWGAVTGSVSYSVYSSTASGIYNTPYTTVAGAVYSCEVTGLTNGIPYYFVVTASNPGGDSAYSNEVSATPKTVPGTPTNVTATVGNGQATVSFTPPVDNGGSAITGYTVTSSPGNITVTGIGTTITVIGLANGTVYTFTVTATNAAGTGLASSASNAVTPYRPSSGGSGGSSTPSVPVSPVQSEKNGVDILVNGKAGMAATATTTQEGNETVTTVTVDDKKVEERLQQEGSKAVVTISVENAADVVIGQLTGQTIKSMESKEAVLEIKTGDITYILPATQINIDNVWEQMGKGTQLKDIIVNVQIDASLQDTAKIVEYTANKNNYQLVVKPVAFEITCTSGNKREEVSRFNGYVERTIAIPDGVDLSKITTGIVLNADGTFLHVPTVITVKDGKYYAKINSLTNSTYTVIYNPVAFKDVASHWAMSSVNDMGSRLVISGVGNDLFEPDRDISRAEFAAIIVRALGLKPGTGSNPFTDVSSTAWYCDYIKTTVENKIISGYGNGKFGPNDKITREQAMTMITRAMNITGLKVQFENGEIDKLLQGFVDSVKLADYAKNSIAACVKTGIISGRNGNMIAPKVNITRAEVAVIVQRLLQKSNLI